MELYSGELVRSSKGRNERTAKQRLIVVSCGFFSDSLFWGFEFLL